MRRRGGEDEDGDGNWQGMEARTEDEFITTSRTVDVGVADTGVKRVEVVAHIPRL